MIECLKLLPVVLWLGWPWLLFAWASGVGVGFFAGVGVMLQASPKVPWKTADGEPLFCITEGTCRGNCKDAAGQRPMPAGPAPCLTPRKEAAE